MNPIVQQISQGFLNQTTKIFEYFKPSLQLSKDKSSGLTWDQAAPSVGKREKQGWVRESWETVVEDWACLSSCHPGEIGVAQHHLNPASPMSVSLTVQSSSIKKPLETAVLLP